MKSLNIQATAPGKLILSGEHAVVYGNPALVMAVNRYVTTTVNMQSGSDISFLFPGLFAEHKVSLATLMQLQKRVKTDYDFFVKGELSIAAVLREPIELIQFALSLLFEAVNMTSVAGMQISLQTDLLIGCGMGSSAAVVLSVLKAVAHALEAEISPELFFQLAHQAETMQHGKSSGIDLQSSLRGGCLYFKEGQVTARTPSHLSFYVINTGQPQTTTGECVQAAATYFKNTRIGHDFSDVTNVIDAALQSNHLQDLIHAIRENHKLLNTIGVVPEKVQQMIAEIEHAGGAAKISGAGAISGQQAGIVLVAIEDESALKKIAFHYQKTILPIQCEVKGVHVHESN